MLREKVITINLIQDVATPHNNVLIKSLCENPDIRLNLWYAKDQDLNSYQWSKNITHEHKRATIYGERFNWSFLRYCLTHPNERYVIVGWMNTNTRWLHLLFFLLGRPYNHWTDLPNPIGELVRFPQQIIRWVAYKILKWSKSRVFTVGKMTREALKKWDFPSLRLVDLPIFVDLENDLSIYRDKKEDIRKKYSLQEGDFLLSSGSRIVYEKGYDLLINAISLLDLEMRKRLKTIIVGSGKQVPELEDLIRRLGLSDQVILEKWLSIEDFKALIANSNVFIHPARVDSYGGTTLGMSVGMPVIGSTGAGAAVDRIEHGKNGFLYEPEDVQTLANLIALLFSDPEMCRRMGQEAWKTAQAWPPSKGCEILVQHSI